MKNLGALAKPIIDITPADLDELCHQTVQETATIEFKEALPAENGRSEPWLQGGSKIGDYAKLKLLREIIAFANSYGGHLFVGIEETDGRPASAKAVKPVPRVAELARRFETIIRDSIDPPLSAFDCAGIETDGQGGGVLVIQVTPGRLAPHRSAQTKEAYRRHGERSETMTMREIQDLTLARYRSDDDLHRSIEARHEALTGQFVAGDVTRRVSFQCVAVPVGTPFPQVARLADHPALIPAIQCPRLLINDTVHEPLSGVVSGHDLRPLLRGLRLARQDNSQHQIHDAFANGTVQTCLAMNALVSASDSRPKIFLGHLLYVLITTLLTAHRHRLFHHAPFTEYAVSCRLRLDFLGSSGGVLAGPRSEQLGYFPFHESPFHLPTYSFGAVDDLPNLVSMFLRDIHNLAGKDPAGFNVVIDDQELQAAIEASDRS
ncbi:MAG: ATP-binding protein [Alphaproteobacteria bacterium]|jgi:hypothetical protein|nr:ATP-binding protein [Alphaproteobacteria bacterium]